MSVFDYPRINVSGVMRINVGTGNNDDYSSSVSPSSNNYLYRKCPHYHLRNFDSANVTLNEEPGLPPDQYIEWMQKVQPAEFINEKTGTITPITPGYWNYFGSMTVWTDDVKVSSVTTGPNTRITQPGQTKLPFIKNLLGGSFSFYRWPRLKSKRAPIKGSDKANADTQTTAIMTDIKSEGSSPGSQIFADNILLRDCNDDPVFYRNPGDSRNYQNSGSKPTKASGDSLCVGGDYEGFYAGLYQGSELVTNPAATAVFQCVMPYSDDFVDEGGIRQFLEDHADDSKKEIKGIVVRYVMYLGVHELNDAEAWAKLYDKPSAQEYYFQMLNERFCPVEGIIAPWYGEEADPETPDFASVTLGREIKMVPGLVNVTKGWKNGPPALPLALSSIIARVQTYQNTNSGTNEKVLSLAIDKALTSYFPDVAGKLTLYVGKDQNDSNPLAIGDVPYGNEANNQYRKGYKISKDPQTFVFQTPKQGMVDFVLNEKQYAILSGEHKDYPEGGVLMVKTDQAGTFQVDGKNTDLLFAEAVYTIVNNQRTLYTEQALPGQVTQATKFRYDGPELVESVFQITRRGKVLTALPDDEKFYLLWCPTVPLPFSYNNSVNSKPILSMADLKLTVQTAEPGSVRYAVVRQEELVNYPTFEKLNNTPMTVAQVRILPNEDYSSYFVDPQAAEPVGNEQLDFEVIYEKVFKPYHVLYPAMDTVRSLHSASAWGGSDSARRLLGRIDQDYFNQFLFMPRTRDLSATRRQLLQAWCRKTLAEGEANNPPT